jgi:hypothetical protein
MGAGGRHGNPWIVAPSARVRFLVIPALPGAGSFDVRLIRGDSDRPRGHRYGNVSLSSTPQHLLTAGAMSSDLTAGMY